MSEDKKRRPADRPAVVNHVGGVSEELGGVDPEVEENLVRLSGGP